MFDNDCDGDVDEEAVDATAYITDADGDGFGDESTEYSACDAWRLKMILLMQEGAEFDCDDGVAEAFQAIKKSVMKSTMTVMIW